jgi:hypothetical protein
MTYVLGGLPCKILWDFLYFRTLGIWGIIHGLSIFRHLGWFLQSRMLQQCLEMAAPFSKQY